MSAGVHGTGEHRFRRTGGRLRADVGIVKSGRVLVTGIAGYRVKYSTSGSSTASVAVEGVHQMLDRELPTSVLFDSLTDSILDACNEASVDNWDGYEARATSWGTCGKAIEFARALPIDLPTPEVTGEAQGGIAFEWRNGHDRVFTVIVRDDQILFAGLYGKSKVYGAESLSTASNLKPIIDGLRRLHENV